MIAKIKLSLLVLVILLPLKGKEITYGEESADFFFIVIDGELVLTSTGDSSTSFRKKVASMFVEFEGVWYRLRRGEVFDGFFEDKNFTFFSPLSSAVKYDPLRQNDVLESRGLKLGRDRFMGPHKVSSLKLCIVESVNPKDPEDGVSALIPIVVIPKHYSSLKD